MLKGKKGGIKGEGRGGEGSDCMVGGGGAGADDRNDMERRLKRIGEEES